ncbi:TlpA disulfide reductase family protein [Velocimicrobium porci]|uniref:TlpA family protein disulfide reductase n=1 Tax=Velocimicrobium porci TaxID=2606634 RepID=A0A6L5XWI8_9FIRM|nr:TlpA disulfide reductase family protein [Velocimicrobium porci]MSS62897.1 TlpA family protein disulfide reductase [Velocimicrobium porci]
MKKVIIVVMVVAIVSLLVYGGSERRAVNDIFQNMDTTDMNGRKVTTEIFKNNKLTVVNVWMTWCTSCIEELPDLQELADEYQKKNVSFKGLIIEYGRDAKRKSGLTEKEKKYAEEILKKANVTYQQLTLSDSMFERFEAINGFPITYILDQKGKLVGKPIAGAHSKEEWKEIIEERLQKV